MQTLPVETKGRAESRALNTLFKPINGKTATTHSKYCAGKYAATVKGRDMQVPDSMGVAALYHVRRTDRDGAYWQIMCIATD